MTTQAAPDTSAELSSATSAIGRELRDELTAWAFLAPALILLIIFLVIPFFLAVGFSFTNQRLISNPNVPTQFVGLDNYITMLQTEEFRRGVLNNFIFVVVVVPVQTSLALFLALLINQKIRFSNLFRGMYFVPVVMPMVVVAVIWAFLYNPGQGTINWLIQTLSGGVLGPYDWLNNPRLAFPSIMALSIWQGVGFQMVIFLAGLQEIPEEVYEAAAIDGVNKIQEVFYITIPMLRNAAIFVILSTTILAFQLFVQVDVLTSGGPENSTMTMMLHVINQGFRQLRVGYASAVTVTFFLIVLAVSLVQQYLLEEERAIE